MKIFKATAGLMTVAAFSIPFHGNANAGGCAFGWTADPVQFDTVIQYVDMPEKINPTLHVLINGKAAKMLLDTGANINVLWETSLLDEAPGSDVHRFDAHVVSAESRTVTVDLADDHGNVLRQEFQLVSNTVLAADGYSGIVSPQAVANDNVAVIDFEKNCFFISPRFDIRSDNGLDVRRGSTISNQYGVMAVPVELDGRKIPLIVDSGASVTTILASLVDSKPKGRKSTRSMDMFGAEVPHGEHMRLVDLIINGKTFKSQSVIPSPTMNHNGIVAFGYIGMDILRDHVIYHDESRKEFVLLTRQGAAKGIVGNRELPARDGDLQ